MRHQRNFSGIPDFATTTPSGGGLAQFHTLTFLADRQALLDHGTAPTYRLRMHAARSIARRILRIAATASNLIEGHRSSVFVSAVALFSWPSTCSCQAIASMR
jgi:hypothetical protein